MKRSLFGWLSVPALAGLLAFAIAPVFAQQTPAAGAMGKIHGQVINPSGMPQASGTVNLSIDGGTTFKYTFNVDAAGNYSGDAAPGTYSVIYRQPDTPKGQMVDEASNVKVVAGQDTEQNIDMSRPEYIAKMSPEQRQQLEELKKQNAAAMSANKVINGLNADLKVVVQDQKDADDAVQTAKQQLGPSATSAALATKVNEIKTAKYNDILSLMTKDTQAKPDEAVLWSKMAYAQEGLKQYDDAITSYKKAIDLETAAKKPRMDIIGAADAGLGEVYARTGKVPEANAAFDAAAKADPVRGPIYLRNQAIIFFQQQNADAQVAAADDALKLSPNDAILYYLKGNGLVQKATMAPDPKNPKAQIVVLPPGCAEAYQKYLELDPNGQFSAEVKGILQSAGEAVSSSYKAGRH